MTTTRRYGRLDRLLIDGQNALGTVFGTAAAQRPNPARDEPDVVLDDGERRHAAGEETDHLAWCAQRLRELDDRPSLLNPLWYAGSYAIGALAGLRGDGWNLGFVAETERQVEAHLNRHLEDLPQQDAKSRAIVEQMRVDEIAHGAKAAALGAAQTPLPVRILMTAMSKVMTTTAYRI